MAWLNSNLIHNLINGATLVLATVTTVAVMTGCTADPVTKALECSASFLPPTITLPVIAGMMGIKLVMNMVRDGLGGLLKVQPPVSDGTATVVVPTTGAAVKEIAVAVTTKK